MTDPATANNSNCSLRKWTVTAVWCSTEELAAVICSVCQIEIRQLARIAESIIANNNIGFFSFVAYPI